MGSNRTGAAGRSMRSRSLIMPGLSLRNGGYLGSGHGVFDGAWQDSRANRRGSRRPAQDT